MYKDISETSKLITMENVFYTHEKQTVNVFIEEDERTHMKTKKLYNSIWNHSKYVLVAFTLALVLYAVWYAVSTMWCTIDIQFTLEFGWYNKTELLSPIATDTKDGNKTVLFQF